jgi:hypothetical protein
MLHRQHLCKIQEGVTPIKILVLGDIHGTYKALEKAVSDSKHWDYSKIVQVGDFGLWDHTLNGVKFLDEANALLSHHGRKIYAIGGNHENWNNWNHYIDNAPVERESGFVHVRSHILLAPRTHRWRWGKNSFYAVAGAASVDKDIRLDDMRAGGSDCWWPQEQITDAEIDGIAELPVDFMFTHDCSNYTPFGFNLIPDFDSQIHRQRIDKALRKLTPKMHFHGHMHKKYDWVNRTGDDKWTHTYGLDCNLSSNVWGILDTDAEEFKFHPRKN